MFKQYLYFFGVNISYIEHSKYIYTVRDLDTLGSVKWVLILVMGFKAIYIRRLNDN